MPRRARRALPRSIASHAPRKFLHGAYPKRQEDAPHDACASRKRDRSPTQDPYGACMRCRSARIGSAGGFGTTAALTNGMQLHVSVVVPAHDEAPNLERLLSELRVALDAELVLWELIVVDDGSTDESPATLARLAAVEPRLRWLRLPVRSGQTAALIAGFRSATAPLIATLDADLQCPPSDLPGLVRALHDTGADLACGIRGARRDPWRRRLVSTVSNGVRRCLLAPQLRDLACPLRVFRTEALRRVEAMTPLFDGAHRWLPALFVLAGLRVVQRPIAHQPRAAGESKYTATGRTVPVMRESGRVLGLALRRSPSLQIGAVITLLMGFALLLLERG